MLSAEIGYGQTILNFPRIIQFQSTTFQNREHVQRTGSLENVENSVIQLLT